MIGRWLSRFDLFLKAYLVMELGCIYFLFNYIEGISFAEKAGESLLFRAFWLVLYVVLLVRIAQSVRPFLLLLSRSYLFLIFLVLALVSTVNGGSDIGAVIKFAMYLMTIMFAAWLSISCPADRFVETLFRLGAVILAFHVVFFPVIGSVIDYDPLHRATVLGTEAYAGVFGHKNLAGSFFGLMAIISFVRLLTGTRSQSGWSALLMALHMLALAATGAAGPLISSTATLVIVFGFFLFASGRRSLASLYLILLGFIGIVLMSVPTDLLYGIVGRTEGLTGRSFLWSVWPYFFWQHPFLGYGFSGFFSGLANAPSAELTQMAPWNTEFGSFENSYMEALLQFGLLGGTFYLLMIARALWSAVVFAFESTSMFWLAPFAILTFILISSNNDSSLLLHNYISCVLVFWCYFGPEARLQAAAQRTFPALHPSKI